MKSNRIVILGAGESGVGAAQLAVQQGFEVLISEAGVIKPAFKERIEQLGLPYEEGGHTWETIFESAEVIKSPGIPDQIPLIRKLQEAGIPVISEIEFAARFTRAKLIGITGSNGKTTTTLLIYHLLRTAGLDVELAGNVGPGFARRLAESDHDYFVLELSSFQLDGIQDFKPDIALLLNITPDHLDRYDKDVRKYGRAKLRIGMNQSESDFFLFRADDPLTAELLTEGERTGKKIPIHPNSEGELLVDGRGYDLRQSSLRGKHNRSNAAFAVQTARLLGIDPEVILAGLKTFKNAPHRLEQVGWKDEVEFINDSKATNVDAVFYALDAMEKPVIWIAGGTDKGNDYGPIQELVQTKVKALICLGIDNRKLRESFRNLEQITETQSVEEAIQLALGYADAGDVVLLSPACASFDLFKNYEDRGDQFRQAVINRIKN
ncbi:MAG: UDP-N-acetylmuramoyl-L-alanine--D-glutamate ligase [Saprospiraceae bacterium]|nr:UDP-N-acetylmuramoyl-L-alanine--D-glutamate ligase [Saprospiraceae bacterium]